jgi:hypothetical protein
MEKTTADSIAAAAQSKPATGGTGKRSLPVLAEPSGTPHGQTLLASATPKFPK